MKYFTVFSSYALFWMFHNKVLPHKVKFSSTLENFIVYTKKKHEINLKFIIYSTHVKRNQFPWIRMFYILWATNNVYVLVYSFLYLNTSFFSKLNTFMELIFVPLLATLITTVLTTLVLRLDSIFRSDLSIKITRSHTRVIILGVCFMGPHFLANFLCVKFQASKHMLERRLKP